MKHQYFGDINDFRKYGLLRCMLKSGNFNLLVAWMLTDPDASRPNDGKRTRYLDDKGNVGRSCADCDDVLYSWLCSKRDSIRARKGHTGLIEESALLERTTFFSERVPDERLARQRWTDLLCDSASDSELVFFDPDNGIEVKSKRMGLKGSSKYVYWAEMKRIWESGKSLLVYQHFPHRNRDVYIRERINEFRDNLCEPRPDLYIFRTSHVAFFLALQQEHAVTQPILPSVWEARDQFLEGRLAVWESWTHPVYPC